MRAADGASVTDEAMLIERAGHRVHLVEGEPREHQSDDAWGSGSCTKRGCPHSLEPFWRRADRDRVRSASARADRPLILAGVRIPFERGLIGHSDADIVCHAVTDAVLGAAGRGDIGRLFPDTAPEWKDADSLELLKRAMEVVHAGGYRVENVDVTVIAERPKLAAAPRRDAGESRARAGDRRGCGKRQGQDQRRRWRDRPRRSDGVPCGGAVGNGRIKETRERVER